MWHVSSCSGVATLRTAIHLLLTYLLTYMNLTELINKSICLHEAFKPMHTSTHLTSLVSLLFTALPVFSGHFSPLASYKFLVLILLFVLALSTQLPQLFGTLFRTRSVHVIHSIHSGGIKKCFC